MSDTCIVAEPDLYLGLLLQRYLNESGFDVVRVGTGQELLRVAKSLRPCLIILDPELPGTLRGWEAVQALHGDGELAAIPIVACSWLDRAETGALAGVGIAGYLQKPDLQYDELAALLPTLGIPHPKGTPYEQ